PIHKQTSRDRRSSSVVQFVVRQSLRILRSRIFNPAELAASHSEKRSASNVPSRDEFPGELRKKSMTRTLGSLSWRFASRISCAACDASESRYASPSRVKTESRD